MKNLTLHKPSAKTSLLVLLVILSLGIPLALYQAQIQQVFRQFASQTNQSATAICSPNNQHLVIIVSFTNKAAKDVEVVAKDLQTGSSADMGVIRPGETKSGEIITESKSLKAGSVVFTTKFSDGSSGGEQFLADYKAVDVCASPSTSPLMCTTGNQGYCRWDALEGAVSYNVVVKEASSGAIIKEESVQKSTTETMFIMEEGKSYQCSVNPVNACGVGTVENSPIKSCPVVVPPYCPAEPTKESSCVWDLLPGASEYKVDVFEVESGKNVKSETIKHPYNRMLYPSEIGKAYKCSVTPINVCKNEGPATVSEPKACTVPSETPYPTSPSPTDIPLPSEEIPSPTEEPTPTPTETPTPTPTSTPVPTSTPRPTSTPKPTPTSRPAPTVRIVQQPQPIVQRGGVQVVQQPQTVPTASQTAQIQPTQTIARPTVVPTGDNTLPVIAGGVTLIMAFIGAIIFFAL